MNVKIGDKIKIKINDNYCEEAKQSIRQLPDRIGTVVEVSHFKSTGKFLTCKVKELHYQFGETHIEYVIVDEEIDRFELIDFD